MTPPQLIEWVCDARERTFELVADLSDEQMLGPQLGIVNPLLWEIGHVAWFQEKWVLRHPDGGSIREDADRLYDSIAVAHDTRWDLPLPSRDATLAYLREVRDRVVDRLAAGEPSPTLAYFTLLSLFHEDMHDEAFTYTRQTHGWPAPELWRSAVRSREPGDRAGYPREARVVPARRSAGKAVARTRDDGRTPSAERRAPSADASIPGGTFLLGAARGAPFVFDNEKWAHPVEVRPFAIARTAVTQAEFAAFVEEGGYRRREFWSEEGWRWRETAGAEHPVYWQREGREWLRRDFDVFRPLERDRPVLHVCWHEAEAYCRWAGRRLPTEGEWELAAAGTKASDGSFGAEKRMFPWGETSPSPERAHLDWGGGPRGALGCVDVDALAPGDSAFGCRQMIGNVWEWTSDDFLPYPGFVIDPYKEYSEPWFRTHKVLRGGCWVTRSRLIRNTWRNFYRPERRDVWAGFRTCAR
jgi:iron(II)-dependent oxidoreductase